MMNIEVLKNLVQYIGRAILQHSGVFTITLVSKTLLMYNDDLIVTVGILIFMWVHFPNSLLMILTFLLVVVFYPILFATAFVSINPLGFTLSSIALLLVHASIGTFIEHKGFEMRVLTNYPDPSALQLIKAAITGLAITIGLTIYC